MRTFIGIKSSVSQILRHGGASVAQRGETIATFVKDSVICKYSSGGKAHLDFQVVQDQELKDILMETYNLDSNEALRGGAPIFLSSANNWVLTRFVDVRIFA